jgi:hypothetical protein
MIQAIRSFGIIFYLIKLWSEKHTLTSKIILTVGLLIFWVFLAQIFDWNLDCCSGGYEI